MLDSYGIPVLRWIDREVLPEARLTIERIQEYVDAWLNLWENGI